MTTTAEIMAAVAQHYRMTPGMLLIHTRRRDVSRPRQVAMWLAREMTGKSYPQIAAVFGKRDHTTVMHAVATINEMCASNAAFAADMAKIRASLVEAA